MTSDLCW